MTLEQYFRKEANKDSETMSKELSVEDKTQILTLYLQTVIGASEVEISNFLFEGVTIEFIERTSKVNPVNSNYYSFWEEVTRQFPTLVDRRKLYELSIGKDKTIYNFLNKLNEKQDVPAISDLAYVTHLLK